MIDRAEITERTVAIAEAEYIVARWSPIHVAARCGLVTDIVASLLNARRLERDKNAQAIADAEKRGAANEREEVAALLCRHRDKIAAVAERVPTAVVNEIVEDACDMLTRLAVAIRARGGK